MINLETLLRVPDVDVLASFDLAPDGRHLAFAWNKGGEWQIHETDLQNVGQITVVSSGPGGKTAPRYSPDGKSIAYALDLDGSESFHIIIHNLTTGKARDLTPNIEFTIQPLFAWSPDSRQIAYLSDKAGNFDLYTINADGSGDRLLFSSGGPAHFVRWAGDGHHIAVTTEKEWQADGTFIVPLDGGEVRRIGGSENPIDADQPVWSPNGSKVAFTSNVSGWTQIGIYHLADETIEWITSNESDKSHPAWSPDGKHIAWVDNYGAFAWVDIRSMDGSRQRVQTETGFAYWPLFTRDSRSIVFIHENSHHPVDIWLAALDDGHSLAPPATTVVTQLTDSLPAELKSAEFAVPEMVTYPSLDGTPIPAILYKPKNVGPHSPAVVVIHGGPAWHFGDYWNPGAAHMVSRGWTVIGPNFRGSTGYGRDWLISNRYEMGHLDNDDCSAAALYLAREGLADPKKIAVTGRSHGGYLTMTCLTRQPELWAAGSAVVPFLNWFTGHETSREDLQYWDIQNMGDPATHHDLWYERSPFFFLDRVRAPVQFICGENDPRCPPAESTEAHEKLKSLGVQSELLLYEGEGHGFLKLENVIDSELKRVEFLAKALEK